MKKGLLKKIGCMLAAVMLFAAGVFSPAVFAETDTPTQAAVNNLLAKGEPSVTDGLVIAAMIDTKSAVAGDDMCNAYLLAVNQALQTGSPTLYTSDTVIGVSAAGMSAAALCDGILIKNLASECAATNSTVLLADNLLALAAGKYEFFADSPITVEQAVNKLLANQNEDGGFGEGGVSSMNKTARALMAMAYYRDYPGVTDAVNNAGGYLVQRQKDNGSFMAEQGDEVLLCALAITGLSMNGFDASSLTLEGPDAVAYLTSAQNPDGGFGAYVGAGSDKNVTVTAVLALVAHRQRSTMTYDFSENLTTQLPSPPQEEQPAQSDAASSQQEQPQSQPSASPAGERKTIGIGTVVAVFAVTGAVGAGVAIMLTRLVNSRNEAKSKRRKTKKR